MKFNGIEKDYLTVLRGRNRPAWAPVNRNIITTLNVPGGYLTSSQTEIRRIDVPVFLMAENFPELQKLKEDMAEWLIHKEPKELIFKDEPDRIYYALVDGGVDLDELIRWGDGVISFICPDPFKYGQEKLLTFPSSGVLTFENEGTAETEPIIELTAKDKATFAMVANSEGEYNLIGKPADVDETIVDEKTPILDEIGDTISSWTQTGQGNFTKGSLGIQVGSYGSGTGWHGPVAEKEITPIEDFEVEFVINITNEHQPERTFQVSINLFDEFLQEIGMMRMWDRSESRFNMVADTRLGSYTGSPSDVYFTDYQNYSHPNLRVWNGIMRLTRKGNLFEIYIARVTQQGKHGYIFKETFRDVDNRFTGRLKEIHIDIKKFGAFGANEIGINRVKVSQLNDLTVDQTPYILDVGDVVTFDHKNKDILLNGESRKDLKNFGGSFFDINKGVNTLTVSPEGVFDAEVTYRDKYL